MSLNTDCGFPVSSNGSKYCIFHLSIDNSISESGRVMLQKELVDQVLFGDPNLSATFVKCEFNWPINYSRRKVEKPIRFEECRFKEPVFFYLCEFQANVEFVNCDFEFKLNCSGSIFYGIFSLTNAAPVGYILNNCIFKMNVLISQNSDLVIGKTIPAEFKLRDVTFESPENVALRNISPRQLVLLNTDISNIKYVPIMDSNIPKRGMLGDEYYLRENFETIIGVELRCLHLDSIIRNYQYLQKIMIEDKDHPNATQFYYREMDLIRRRGGLGPFWLRNSKIYRILNLDRIINSLSKVFNWHFVYKCLSGFGTTVIRPILILVGVLLLVPLFFNIGWGGVQPSFKIDINNFSGFWEALRYYWINLGKNLASVFYINKNAFNQDPGISTILIITLVFEKFMAAILISLSVLSFRRKIKRN